MGENYSRRQFYLKLYSYVEELVNLVNRVLPRPTTLSENLDVPLMICSADKTR